jgi:TnpA family transposase
VARRAIQSRAESCGRREEEARAVQVGLQGVKVRRRHHEEQVNRATCLTLVTNAAILWNTVYLEAAIDRLRSEGVEIDDETLAHLSPALWDPQLVA